MILLRTVFQFHGQSIPIRVIELFYNMASAYSFKKKSLHYSQQRKIAISLINKCVVDGVKNYCFSIEKLILL